MNILTDKNIRFELIEHVETFDAQHLAHAVHTPGRQVAKTVLLKADGGYRFVVAVLPATERLDLDRVSKALGGSQLQLATEHEVAAHCPDCEVGALPPFGSLYGMRTIVDEQLARGEWIVFEGSTHCEAIRMRVDDFQRLECPLIAPLTRHSRAGIAASSD